jgi:hypothetical protein
MFKRDKWKRIYRGIIFFGALSIPSGATFAGNTVTLPKDHRQIMLQKNKEHFLKPVSTVVVSSALLQNHGGSVMHRSQTLAIFWGPKWQTDRAFTRDKISGLDTFFSGISGSSYGRTANEYYDRAGCVTGYSTYLGHVIDRTSVPAGSLSSEAAVAEVCKITANNPNPNALYLIYTDTVAGNVDYCGWHDWGTCANGRPLNVAYVPNIDGVAGCDPGDTSTNHSQGLAALANVSAHELMETTTDPQGNTWYDSNGAENGDKCAWSFPPALSIFSNGSQWKLQMEWSNAAYQAENGLPNASGQRGCIY